MPGDAQRSGSAAAIARADAIAQEIAALKLKLAEARRDIAPEPVQDATLAMAGSGAPVRLSQLFGDKPDLILIHNMGRRCSYCTLWADGFAGVYRHLASRCSFVLCSPDDPGVAGAFASSRQWPFPVVSLAGSSFGRDMGFQKPDGGVTPGASAYAKGPGGSIVRAGYAPEFGPGDDFCAVWHLLGLLKDGAAGWEPKYHYA